MAKEKDIVQDEVSSTPATELNLLRAQVAAMGEKVAASQAQTEQLQSMVNALLANRMALSVEKTKDRHELLVEKSERQSQALRDMSANIEKSLAEGERTWFVSMTDEPQMQRKVGAKDEANAKEKFIKYHGIRAIMEPNKEIVVEPYKRGMEELLPAHVKDALTAETHKTAT